MTDYPQNRRAIEEMPAEDLEAYLHTKRPLQSNHPHTSPFPHTSALSTAMMDHYKQLQQPVLLPMAGRVIVELLTEERTPGGLYLPNTGEHRATIGKIVALPGFLASDIPEGEWPTIGEEYMGPHRTGDVVLFGQNSGMSIDIGYGAARRKAVILRESEVLCKVTQANGEPYA